MKLPTLSEHTAEHLLHDYVLGQRNRWAVLKASGERLREYLQGQLTQDIRRLTDTQGIHACLLTPQGKPVSDLYLFDAGNEILLLTPSHCAEVTVARLRHFSLGYSLRIGIVDALAVCSIQGAGAAQALEIFDLPQPTETWLASSRHASKERMAVVMPASPRGFWVIAGRGDIEKTCAQSAHAVDEGQLEAMRVIRGLPEFGTDWDAQVHPLNANLIESDGVSFDKGCYVGQEVTSRMHWRGGIRKKLYRVMLHGLPETLPCPLIASAPVGTLRSAAIDHQQQCYGIAWLPIEVADAGTALRLQNGVQAEVLEPCHV